MELTPEQVILVGLIASVLVQALKFLSGKLGYEPGRVVVNVVLFVVAVVLAIVFGGLPEVAADDPIQLALALLKGASTVIGLASLVYNLLLEKIYGAVGLT